jgi:anthranilate synthase, component I (EC 4.1.3.27)
VELSLSFEEFKSLSKEYDVIPIFVERLADTDTPLSLFLKLKGVGQYRALLESAEGGVKWGRFSFIAFGSRLYYKFKDGRAEVWDGGKKLEFETKDPFEYPRELLRNLRVYKDQRLPRFWGGLVGYVSYDVIRFFEPIKIEKPKVMDLPEVFFFMTDCVLIHDNLSGKIKVVAPIFVGEDAQESYSKAKDLVENVLERVYNECVYPKHYEDREPDLSIWQSNFKKEEFEKAVLKAKEYIAQGDVIQVVLSQRFKRSFKVDPEDIYRVLRFLNPSPYMFYLDFLEYQVVGSSPEVLVRVEQRKVLTRPIAGTRRRGKNEEEDKLLEEELLKDEKERAEHLMLVDLGRNDLGRVCKPGTVVVKDFMRVERYSHVMHLVSDVEGEALEGLSPFDILKACFPAGTVSGAPKVRAMQIIEELEPERRGIYAGSVGYVSFEGNMDMAIAIRTLVCINGEVFVQAGAGIVADSEPHKEWLETVNKAKALIKAVDMAEKMF